MTIRDLLRKLKKLPVLNILENVYVISELTSNLNNII